MSTAHVVRIIQTAKVAEDKLSGLTKLGTTPSGGVPAGYKHRSIPLANEDIVSGLQSLFYTGALKETVFKD